jgi:hypothetical protein
MLERLLVLIPVLWCGASLPAVAQPEQPQNAIHVVGWGEIEAEPDMATFNFAIQGTADSPQNARMRADTISADLVRRLERLGVETDDIRSTPVTLNPYIDNETRRELVSFNRTTTAILCDLDDFDAVQNAAFEAGANAMGGVELGLSNEQELLTQARDLALMDARAQAEGIAKTMGVEVGRVLSVTVTQQRGVVPLYRREAPFAVADAVAPEHRTGVVEITQDASVSFEIIQQPFIARP